MSSFVQVCKVLKLYKRMQGATWIPLLGYKQIALKDDGMMFLSYLTHVYESKGRKMIQISQVISED